MFIYFLKRLAYIFFILWLISIIIFSITQILPGNVAKMIMDQWATPESIQALEKKLGLNDPLYTQYLRWAKSIIGGEFGLSLTTDQPIITLISTPLQRSATLAILSFFIVAVSGIFLGILAAVRRNTIFDYGISTFSFFGISVPEFFWGIILMLLFSRYFGLFPASGYVSFSESPYQWLSHLILPAATLGFTLLARVFRLTRSSMLEVLESNYVRVARAKGLPERMVIFKHALKNALLPTITVLAMNFGWLMGGIVVVEEVFAFPGFGRLLLYAIQRRDLPLIQAGMLIVTSIYCIMNLIADLLYSYFNPRIRYGAKEK